MHKTRAICLALAYACAAIASASLFVSRGATPATQTAPVGTTLYDADPAHLWNRLHDTLFFRTGIDEHVYGQDRFEPLLWTWSHHLIEGQSNAKAVATAEEFLAADGQKLIDDPLKRAILQRDLWMVFNSLQLRQPERMDAQAIRAPKDRLCAALAKAIKQLALTSEQIRRLPDTYASAVASKKFARQFDAEHPEKPYLPPDLFAADGPWICVGRSDGVTAPLHLADENPYANSSFTVFLRLPAGRAATVDYLRQLTSFDKPLFIGESPNLDLPQLPKGAELALVRHALLIDRSSAPVISPIIESIQLRIMRSDPPAMTPQVYKDRSMGRPGLEESIAQWQTFQEFRLSRKNLFTGLSGGLHAVEPAERDFKTGFNAPPYDQFEGTFGLRTPENFQEQAQQRILQCYACHGQPGVYAFNSFFNFRLSNPSPAARPSPLKERLPSEVDAAAIKRATATTSWAGLKELLSN